MGVDTAILDPSAVFETPERLRESAELTRAEKVELLERWAYDDSEMSVAIEEGMPEGRPSDLQQRILLALADLGAKVDLEHTGPTKQHGLPGNLRTAT
jgi:hypothetical protein